MKTINCARCGKNMEYRPNRKYCIPCRRIRDDELAKEYINKHYKGGPRRKKD